MYKKNSYLFIQKVNFFMKLFSVLHSGRLIKYLTGLERIFNDKRKPHKTYKVLPKQLHSCKSFSNFQIN